MHLKSKLLCLTLAPALIFLALSSSLVGVSALTGPAGIAAAIALVVDVLLAWRVAGAIVAQLGGEPEAAVRLVQAIGQAGDKARPREASQLSLIGQLQGMQEDLRKAMAGTREAARRVSTSAEALASTAQRVSGNAEMQSQATAAAAASVEQLTVSIDHISASASEAASQVVETSKLAEEGNQAIEASTAQIMTVGDGTDKAASDIQSLSREVGRIGHVAIVIKEVADQTNLLALNAAIEAARAGEHGRGFAVVADEVRKLAERTTQSVAEISKMIAAIQGETDAAVTSMQSSRDLASAVVGISAGATGSMAQLSYYTDAAVASVGAVSDSLAEQRAATSELARNIESIAQSAEENVSAMDSIVSTAGDLQTAVAELESRVELFGS